MNIDSAIESFFAWLPKNCAAPVINDNAHPIFYLGADTDRLSAIESIEDEVFEGLRYGIPFPFRCQFLFTELDSHNPSAVQAEFGVSFDVATEILAEGGSPEWGVTFAFKKHEDRKYEIVVLEFIYGPKIGWTHVYAGGGELKPNDARFMFSEYLDWESDYGAMQEAKKRAEIVKHTAYSLALIAHPANYIVRETPLLTPKEQRRVAAGKRFPGAKLPRYVIVDHDVLASRMKPQGTHAAPVPHQRRGHWRRLAERCKLARARGVDRTWVRDCKIGETDFVAHKRRYQVLTDFHERYNRPAGGPNPESV